MWQFKCIKWMCAMRCWCVKDSWEAALAGCVWRRVRLCQIQYWHGRIIPLTWCQHLRPVEVDCFVIWDWATVHACVWGCMYVCVGGCVCLEHLDFKNSCSTGQGFIFLHGRTLYFAAFLSVLPHPPCSLLALTHCRYLRQAHTLTHLTADMFTWRSLMLF